MTITDENTFRMKCDLKSKETDLENRAKGGLGMFALSGLWTAIMVEANNRYTCSKQSKAIEHTFEAGTAYGMYITITTFYGLKKVYNRLNDLNTQNR